jgi:hypothetical protein
MGREGLNKAARRATRESAVRVRLTKTGGGGGGGGRKFQGGRAGGGRHRQDRTSLCKKKDAAGAAGCGLRLRLQAIWAAAELDSRGPSADTWPASRTHVGPDSSRPSPN